MVSWSPWIIREACFMMVVEVMGVVEEYGEGTQRMVAKWNVVQQSSIVRTVTRRNCVTVDLTTPLTHHHEAVPTKALRCTEIDYP